MRTPDARESTPEGPIYDPVDRFSHLSPVTRKWLEGLRESEIDEIRDALKFVRNARTLGRFGRWLMISLIAFMLTVGQIGDALQKIGYYIGKLKP